MKLEKRLQHGFKNTHVDKETRACERHTGARRAARNRCGRADAAASNPPPTRMIPDLRELVCGQRGLAKKHRKLAPASSPRRPSAATLSLSLIVNKKVSAQRERVPLLPSTVAKEESLSLSLPGRPSGNGMERRADRDATGPRRFGGKKKRKRKGQKVCFSWQRERCNKVLR